MEFGVILDNWPLYLEGLVTTVELTGLCLILGLLLAWQGEWWHAGWWHAKFALVCVLTFVHHVYGRWRKTFEADRNIRPANYYRWWNEVPTLLMIVIVFLVVLKPF